MDKSISNVEVKIISREAVKPSIPTPPHCKHFTLSYLDQMLPLVPPFLTCGLLFYTDPLQTHNSTLLVDKLKSSLSKTLATFYPLAGRINQSTITCNDEGIPFIEAMVNCPMSLVLNSIVNLDSLVHKLFPPRDSLGLLGACAGGAGLVHLAIQINNFTCGGVAIGWYDIHKVMDGTSSATFFNHWATLASQKLNKEANNSLVVQPNFEVATTMFPPLRTPNILNFENGYEHNKKVSIVYKSFIFSKKAIDDLKTSATSELVPNPTSFQALSGFIWEQLILVSQIAHFDQSLEDDSILQVTIDMRPFTNPPLPKGSMGNLVNTAIARAKKTINHPSLVAKIQLAVSKMKDEIKEYDGVEGVRASWDKLIATLGDKKDNAYKVVSWCKLGFDLDFGFGKPKCMVPTDGIMSPFHKNLVILTNSMDESSVEAWFFLEEKEMEILESYPHFLAFASRAYC